MNTQRLVELDICRNQGRIYRRIARDGYDVAIFSEEYLKSDFCRRSMDTIYSRYQYADELECLDFILPEIGEKMVKHPDQFFNEDVADWIGYIYRLLYYDAKTQSSILADQVPFSLMCSLYPALHTLDNEDAITIIRRDCINNRCISPKGDR